MQIETNIGEGTNKLVSPLRNHKTHKTIRVGGASLNAARAIKKYGSAHKILRGGSSEKGGAREGAWGSFTLIHFLPDVPESSTPWSWYYIGC